MDMLPESKMYLSRAILRTYVLRLKIMALGILVDFGVVALDEFFPRQGSLGLLVNTNDLV